MSARRRAGMAAAVAVLALGAAACGATAPPSGPPPMPMMTARPAPPGVGIGDQDDDGGRRGPMMSGAMPTYPTSPTSPTPHTGTLPGEGLDAAAVTELQTAVDHGAQPWRLDRVTVAAAFARGRLGWMMPSVRDTGTTVLVEGPDHERVTLTLAQPGRPGPTGVWVVTGGSWVP